MGLNLKELTENLVASPPGVYFQLKKAIDNPDSNFEDFSKIISGDPSLAARLLKIVNSPFYGLEAKVETITHALNVIGTSELSELALATSVITKFTGIPEDLILVHDFWKHSIACGVAARKIAQHKKVSNPERYYLAGMLHDIGKLVLYKEVPSKAKEVMGEYYRREKEPLIKVEKEIIGFDHTEIGALILKEWQLPLSLVTAVRYHHFPLLAKKHIAEAAIVHVADFMVYEMELGSSGEPTIPPLDAKTLSKLGLTLDFVRDAQEDVLKMTDSAIEMFY